MSDVSVDARIKELSAKVDSLIWGYKMGALVLLFLFSIPNISTAVFLISKCRQIYSVALPGRPLPLITDFLLTHQFFVIGATCLWPVLGLLALLIPKKNSTCALIIISLLVLVALQIMITVIALLTPIGELVTGISNSH